MHEHEIDQSPGEHMKTQQEPVEKQFHTLMSLHDLALFSVGTVKQSIPNLFAY